MNRSSITPALALCAAIALPATASAKASSQVKAGPLPKLSAVSPLAAAMPGAHVPVRATLKGRSARTRLTYLLSTDRRPSASDRRLAAVTVPALRPGTTRTVTRTLAIPARGKIGSWYLLACVGAGKKPQCSAVPLPILAKPSPRSVSVATDATHAASQLVTTTSGGTLTATGADGSTYTLTLPAGALASDETITLTPVSSLRGLKAGTPAAGVQLAPDGLALLKPASLTITPAHPVPVADQIGYVWHGAGRESGIYAPTTDPKSFTLTLNHFSGYELVDGNAAARTALSNQPTNIQDRYADFAKAVAADRAAGDTGAANAAFTKATVALLQTQYDAVVKPALAAALTDDTLAESAIQTGLTWARTAQKLGAFDAEAGAVMKAVVQIVANALDQSAKRCQADVAYTERVLYLSHVLAVLGVSDSEANAAFDKVQRCLEFELDFTSSTIQYAGWRFVADTQITGLKISALGASTINQVNAPTPVSGHLQYTRLAETTGGAGCSYTFGTPQEQEPFTVYRLEIDSTLREVIDPQGHATFQTPAPQIGMEMSPGNYPEPFTVNCRDSAPQPGMEKVFTSGWILTHQSEANHQGHYDLLNWTPGTNGVLAQKTYDQTFMQGDVGATQQSTFTIKYAMGQ